MKKRLIGMLAMTLTTAAGCAVYPGPGGKAGSPGADAGPGPSSSAAKPTIFTIVLENHDYAEIVASKNAPYINSLIAQYGLATNYRDTGHPSLPNYLHMISGANQYSGSDRNPTSSPFPVDQPNLATQLEKAGIKWRSYQESMTTPCKLSGSGNYAPKHDPFLYFTDQQNGANGLCASTNVSFTKFSTDLASNKYRYMWITPNLIDDGHNPSTDPVKGLKDTDAWLSQQVPKILASKGFKAGGVLFVTWDEAEGRNGDDPDRVPMIIVSPRIKAAGMTSNTAYDHSSYLATVEDLLGLPRLATVKNAPSMLAFLHSGAGPDAGVPPTDASVAPADGGGTCAGLADPDVPQTCCTSCTGGSGTCQNNGCYGGWYCNTSTCKCVAPPTNCSGGGGGTTSWPPAGAPLTCTMAGAYNQSNYSGRCGVWRWSIKTGTDSNVGKVDPTNIVPTTITHLIGLTPPNLSLTGSTPPRQSPMETTVWELKDIHITHVGLEADSDEHMEITDGAGHDMVAEIPYPGCVASSGVFGCNISQARAALEKAVPSLSEMNNQVSVNLTASLVGIGFFDFVHMPPVPGSAANGAEIHPVLRICFGKGCDPTANP